jgi:hypothetical protein
MAHELEQVGLAVHMGERGGGRSVARCRCGWRSRSTLTVTFALAELEAHVASAPAA